MPLALALADGYLTIWARRREAPISLPPLLPELASPQASRHTVSEAPPKMEAPEGAPGLQATVREMSTPMDERDTSRDLKYWEPEKLKPVHFQIVALSASGKKNFEIADLLGVTEPWVSVILNHPDAQMLRSQLVARVVESVTDDTAELIKSHTREAFMTVVELMRSAKKEETRQRSAFDILDRGGFKPRDVHVNTNINLGREDAELIADALSESSQDVPKFREVESMEVLLSEESAPPVTEHPDASEELEPPGAGYGAGPDSQ